MSTTAERMKAAREHYNLTQADFATALSVKQSYLSYIEHGKRPPSEKLLAKMYRIYNINAEWVLNGVGAMIDGEPVDVKSLPPSNALTDRAILKTIISTIERCAEASNKRLEAENKADMIINFYQYFFAADKNMNHKEIKRQIELSFDIMADVVRRKP